MSDYVHSLNTTVNHGHVPTYWPDYTSQIISYPPPPKEDQPMTTLEKIQAERREVLERKRIEQAYEDYDDLGLPDQLPGQLISFWAGAPDHRRLYAALWIADLWYVTGDRLPHGVTTEDFVAWLIGRDVPASTVRFHERAPGDAQSRETAPT